MRIAFTGSHGVGKTTVSKLLWRKLEEEIPGLGITILGSSTRSVLSWGRGTESGGECLLSPEENGFQLACIYERRRMMLSKGAIGADIVISERWAMDETSYQLHKARTKGDLDAWHTLRVCQMEMEWEYNNYWDAVYYIPVTDREVEGDGTRPTDKDYQLEIDGLLKDGLKSLKKTTKIKVVPTDLDRLDDFFSKEIETWKKKYLKPKNDTGL